ncbi:MAG TPA: HAMP domain-containing sensor histidine kinase [Candidatus Dormibacteraeota bacterium]|nr:HAMP domain-containing sensor histidine kinase [Candidatus Dormibacteraeota bacterium]
MTPVVLVQDVTAAAFVALGLAMAYRWNRDRGRAQGKLAISLVALGVVALVGRLPAVQVLSLVVIVALMLSAYFVLLFRDEFLPLSRRAHWVGGIVFAAGTIDGIVLLAVQQRTSNEVMTSIAFLYVLAWAALIGEPIARFWLASNSLPAVQKARMRFLSVGFGLLILILFVDVLGGAALRSPTAIVITQLLALATVPLIYVSFAPPALLRRIWRMGEENEVRAALQDLLIFSPTRKDIAERAVFWAVRLLGGTRGYILDAGGNLLAGDAEEPGDAVVRATLHLPEGEGKLAVVAGTFTPLFGTDEVSQLRAYANSVSAGIQRVTVTERLAAIEKNKTQFLNLASHELRGPVTVIRGYVSMLESGMLGTLNERGHKAADVMSAKVLEMNDLIEEMIEAARLEEGGVTLRVSDTDLRDVARAAADMVAPLVDGEHRIELDLPDRRVRVRIDPDRTRTIIANLLTNALKYSPDGGEVTCQVRARGGVARVTVTDEGLGIAHEHLPTLFTRFGRVITPQTEHLKGTGLGLFLARQLARLQGGDITVASVEGKGSTFTLQLPVASQDGSADETGKTPGDAMSFTVGESLSS